MTGFLYWSEPQTVWVEDGVQLLVGGGEVTGRPNDGNDRAFLCIQTGLSTTYTCLSARALDELMTSLADVRKAMGDRS
jgi:hypothetical protein